MGYNIYIGNARLCAYTEDKSVYIDVEIIDGTLLGAPLDSQSKSGSRENMILPGYSTWGAFCRRAGLHDVFFHPDGDWVGQSGECHRTLFPRAEGTSLLHEDLLLAFEEALCRHRPGRCVEDGVDWDHRRLAWLAWWTRWALVNCEFPVIHHG